MLKNSRPCSKNMRPARLVTDGRGQDSFVPIAPPSTAGRFPTLCHHYEIRTYEVPRRRGRRRYRCAPAAVRTGPNSAVARSSSHSRSKAFSTLACLSRDHAIRSHLLDSEHHGKGPERITGPLGGLQENSLSQVSTSVSPSSITMFSQYSPSAAKITEGLVEKANAS